jgi:hypothetical protein
MAYGARGEGGGGDVSVWICWISLGMLGLRYVRVKGVRLRCGGLDTVEGLLKTVNVFDKSILGGKADLMFQNVCCKVCMRKLCVLWGGIHLSRLVVLI